MKHLAPTLTRERAATMHARELVVACAAQVDAQHPAVDAEEHQRLTVDLYTKLASERHREEFAKEMIREEVTKVEHRLVVLTAEHLACPIEADNGHLKGVIAYNANGEHMNISLQFAKPEHFENPWYMHTHEFYMQTAALLRRHGFGSFREAYDAGVLHELHEAPDEPRAS